MLTSEPESQQNLESNAVSHGTVVGAFRRKLKLSESAEKLALEASQCIDYGGQSYRLIDVNKLHHLSQKHVFVMMVSLTLVVSFIQSSTPNPTDKDIEVSIYAMKKNTMAILHQSVQSKDLKKQHRFCPPGWLGLTPGANGNRIKL